MEEVYPGGKEQSSVKLVYISKPELIIGKMHNCNQDERTTVSIRAVWGIGGIQNTIFK